MGNSSPTHRFAADFEALVDQAVVHASLHLAESRGLVGPYAMIVDEGEPCIRRFAEGDPDRMLCLALAFASLGGYEFWAVAWEGQLEIAGRRVDALFVRAGSEREGDSVLIARSFQRSAERPLALESLGAPVLLPCDERL